MQPKHQPKVALQTSSDKDPIAAARRKAAATERKQAAKRNNQSTMVAATLICGLAIIGIFAGLEFTKPKPAATPPQQTAQTGESAETPQIPAAPQPPKPQTPPAPATSDQPETTRIAGNSTPATPATNPRASTETRVETAETETSFEDSPFGDESDLILTGFEALRETNLTRDREMLARAISSRKWNDYRGLLQQSIGPALANTSNGRGLNKFDQVWQEPVLYQALLRWHVLGCFKQHQITEHVVDSYSAEFLVWLLNDSPAMEEFLLTFKPADDGSDVLKFLIQAWSMTPDDFRKYYPLALACAVVFDQPVSIPHPVGSKERTVNPLKRFQWYVAKNDAGKLAAPIHRMTARDLIWTVCAPITTSEMEWAISNVHYHRKNWGNAYSKITYLMERAVENLNPYEEYSFAEILKEGGICGDQSYYCVNTARAQGIPAMTIAGETNRGGHAWAGVKISDREWNTSIGRISGVSKGQTHNPQTNRKITEQEILLWNDRLHQSPVATLGIWRHLWLASFFKASYDTENQAEAIRIARQTGSSFPEVWNALYDLMEEQTKLTGTPPKPDNLEQWQDFAKSMRLEFRDNPRMASLAGQAELKHIFPYCDENEARLILNRERRRIERDAGEQSDLVASSLKREAELLLMRGGPDAKKEIMRLYDKALRDYGGSVTGFKTMAKDYFSYFQNDPELGRKVVRDIELTFNRVLETGSKEWFTAKTEASIYKMICQYYRTAGDPKRAEKLEKRYEIQLRRAKRGAL